MNGPTILPANNPVPLDALGRRELIERLTRLEDEAIRGCRLKNRILNQLHTTSGIAFELGRRLYELVDAYDDGDMEAVGSLLRLMSERRKQLCEGTNK